MLFLLFGFSFARSGSWRLSGSGRSLLGSQHLGDDLLLLDEEGAHNTVSHTGGTLGTTIGSGDGLSSVGQTSKIGRSGVGDASQLQLTVTTLGDGTILLGVQIDQATTGGLGTVKIEKQEKF